VKSLREGLESKFGPYFEHSQEHAAFVTLQTNQKPSFDGFERSVTGLPVVRGGPECLQLEAQMKL